MFIKKSVLKKMIKTAYAKEYLHIRNTGHELIFGSLYWIIKIDFEAIPKEIKAALIECCGELPDIGEQYLVTKDGNQLEVATLDIRTETGLPITYLKLGLIMQPNDSDEQRRLYQSEVTGTIIAAPEYLAANMGNMYLAENESAMNGPVCAGIWLTWSNSSMILQAMRYKTDEYAPAIEALENLVRNARDVSDEA